MSTIARLVGCSKTYRSASQEVHAMDHVDLEIAAGDFLALCGPSGSGKTTILNVLGGLDQPDEGQVFIGDRELGTLGTSALATLRLERLGFVFQAYNLVPVLSAVENVAFVLELAGVTAKEANDRARAMLAQVGLESEADRRPGELSGGQQQRVAVARAIVTQPQLVLADEPTANLDSATAQSLLDLLVRLNEEHEVTMVFSTHDARVMARARTLVHLVDGRIEKIDDRERAT